MIKRNCNYCEKDWTHAALMERDAERPPYMEFVCDEHVSVIKISCVDIWTREEYETNDNEILY